MTGLAAGDISKASSTDAVNGGQLYTVNNNIATALGTTLDSNGALVAPTYTVNNGQGSTTEFTNVKDALAYITGVDVGSGSGAGVGIKYFHTNSTKDDSRAQGTDSIAVGPEAIASGASSIAMGDKAQAYQKNNVAIGTESAAIGLNSTAIGSTTGTARAPEFTKDANGRITAIDGLDVTTDPLTDGKTTDNITAINGTPVTTTQVNALLNLLSSGSNLALGKNSLALGTSNLATGESSVALGDSSKAVANKAIAIGANGTASGEEAVSIGAGAKAVATGSLALGASSSAGRDGAVALGQGASADTTGGVSIGQNAGLNTTQGSTNDRTDLIAIGRDSGQNVVGNRNIAMGVGAGSNLSVGGNDSSDDNIAIGVNAGSNINGDDNISIGRDSNKNVANIAESVAIGSEVDATTGSTVLGNSAKATGGDYATVVGYQAKVTGDSGTALGRDSEASTNNVALGASSVAKGTSTGAAYLTGDLKTGGFNIVSVGQAGQERRITNVAAGANSTDAVNVSQLKQAQQKVADLIGGKTTVNDAGDFGGYVVELEDTGGTKHQYKTVAEAINAVSSGQISVLPGNAVLYTPDGRIANVAAGTAGTDAVNLNQLNAAIAANGQHHVSINTKNPANENNTGAAAEDSLAIGAGVTTSNAATNSVAMGFNTSANAKESVAIGNTSTQANGDSSIAIGKTALAKSTNNIAMGTNASSNGMESIAIGANIQIDKTAGTSDYAVGIGSYSEIQNADQAIAIGRKAVVQGDNGTAIGHEALAAQKNASALGNSAEATAVSATAIGNEAKASGTSANAIGDNANASDESANAIGNYATATKKSANAIGDHSNAAAENANAIGTQAQATGINANAMGNNATATKKSANAIGDHANAAAENANAIGNGAQALRDNTLAIGTSAISSGLQAIAIGNNAGAAGENANAFGNGAKASADNSNAMGTGTNVSATNGLALGTGATVTHTSAVALGSGSISGVANPTEKATINGKDYYYAGINPTSTVSVGSVGNERQIINVAAGRVSGTSTDAINGSQLFQTNEELANLANKTAQALGGGAAANQADGGISLPSYTVTTNPAGSGTKSTVSNVGDALAALDKAVNQPLGFAGDSGTASRKLGETLNIKGGATGTLTTGNIGVVANGTNQLDIRLAEKIDLGTNGSVNAGGTVINSSGLSFVDSTGTALANTPSIGKTGINAGNQKITNVKAGDVNSTSTDAVNGSQLYGTANSLAQALGGNSTVGADGKVTAPSYSVNGQAITNVGAAITALDKGWTVNSDGKLGTGTAVKAGDTVDIGLSDGETNLIHTAKTVNGVTTIDFGLSKDLKLDSVNAGGTVINSSGLSFVDSTGTALANTPSIGKTGINAGNQKITNVKAGDVNSTSTDAVNGSQLYGTANSLAQALGGNSTVGADGKVTAPSYSVNGQAITNVGAAITALDKGWTVNSDGKLGTGTAVKAGDTVDIGLSDGETNLIHTAKTVNGVTTIDFGLSKDLKLDSVNAGGTVINSSGLSFVDSTGTALANTPSIGKTGINAGNQKITSVGAGSIGAGSTDAVNGSQIHDLVGSTAYVDS
ncbi:beta strand repeat-containing protein, partial [Acinetobacter pragensis]|uniref:beta strand repeat-containing protein n=1 Tax=Acinetobacter pragensis TaxID=1806892 RepID=UPI0039F0D036